MHRHPTRRYAKTAAAPRPRPACDRFEGVGFTRSAAGYAILDDVLAVIECKRLSVHDGGDHSIIVGEVETTRAEAGTPLLYYRGGYAQLEH